MISVRGRIISDRDGMISGMYGIIFSIDGLSSRDVLISARD